MPRETVTVELQRQTAFFLCEFIADLNRKKVLPRGDREALATSAWLEEIEAKTAAALEAPDAA